MIAKCRRSADNIGQFRTDNWRRECGTFYRYNPPTLPTTVRQTGKSAADNRCSQDPDWTGPRARC